MGSQGPGGTKRPKQGMRSKDRPWHPLTPTLEIAGPPHLAWVQANRQQKSKLSSTPDPKAPHLLWAWVQLQTDIQEPSEAPQPHRPHSLPPAGAPAAPDVLLGQAFAHSAPGAPPSPTDDQFLLLQQGELWDVFLVPSANPKGSCSHLSTAAGLKPEYNPAGVSLRT